MTQSPLTWIIVKPEGELKGGVYRIKSGAPGNDRTGKPYSEW
jgi:general secretion pathway protein G